MHFSSVPGPHFAISQVFRLAPVAEWNRENRTDAQSYLLVQFQFTFILALLLTRRVLGFKEG